MKRKSPLTTHSIFLVLMLVIAGTNANRALFEAKIQGKLTSFCASYNYDSSALPNKMPSTATQLVYSIPSDGCTIDNKNNYTGSFVLINRGNCSFYEKAIIAQNLGAFGVIIINNSSDIFPPQGNETEFSNINIPVAMLSNGDAKTLRELNINQGILYAPVTGMMDPNIFVTLIIATSLVVLGSIWANTDASGPVNDESSDVTPVLEINMKVAILYVLGACVMLVVLYFLYDFLVYIIIGIFCLGSASGIYTIMITYLGHKFPSGTKKKIKYVGTLSVKSAIFTVISLIIPLIWFCIRHNFYSFILQDFLGIVIILLVMQTVRLTNIKISAIMLVLFFFYDIFFVFITPLFTKNGESIMVKVATGGSGSHETIPLTLMVPRFSDPYSVCGASFSILGYGDIVLPGLLVSFCLYFDKRMNTWQKKSYFVIVSSAYFFGLVSTYIGLISLKMAQPALLYLVPFTLGSVLFFGWKRNELRYLWYGPDYKPTYIDSSNDEFLIHSSES
eukprot:TRINITY_DN9557_c0_g1_i1.p1 TRINITY_DN9557_c0_g1~~TRINITY_DN9557_c0_g1_i1.p1  ORF type:complete len:504 (-),score=62.78 TRINITY_DN9557_c0_g1_i1:36-1547(-)